MSPLSGRYLPGFSFSGDLSHLQEYNTAPPTTVPEPAAWVLMLLGFAGVGVMVRCRGTPFISV